MKFLFPLILLFFCLTSLYQQPLQVTRNYDIIIDTDCGADDYRAINILLARPEISVKGIIVTDGNILPEEGFNKVTGFLQEIGKDSIPVGCGKNIHGKGPAWREYTQSLKWSSIPYPGVNYISSMDLLSEIITPTGQKITLVCLGPLSDISEFIEKKPGMLQGIDRIIWYNDSVNPLKGFNYEYDSLAVKRVINSHIRMDVISNLMYPNSVFDTTWISKNNVLQTSLSEVLSHFYHQNIHPKNFTCNQLTLFDELAALYLCIPALFDMNPEVGKTRLRYSTAYDLVAIREVMKDMIRGTYFPEKNVVFTKFPAQRELFSYDVRQIMDSAIARYGDEEWKACVITDEFHGHLGVYSIVGAKMGIKAREIFGVGPDVLKVVTYAGLKPPYSCLTDGIQVSTGATLGMGLISVATVNETRAMAEFSYKNRTIRLSLKDEYLKQVEADIMEGIVKFGLMDDGYWKLVRQSALKYWLDWDRNKIFTIEEVQSQ